MHQGHNIPWSTFEKHFTFVVEDKRYTPPFTGLLYKESPAAVKELQHFVRKFAATIKEFSETERKKFPAKVPSISPTDKVFSDELRDKYPKYLTKRLQSLSFWINPGSHYAYGDGDRKHALMVLLLENEMETLLMLAHHPQIRMAQIVKGGCEDYHAGRGEETALSAYLVLNTMEATGQLSDAGYARTPQFMFLIHNLNMWRRSCGQYVAHETLPRACEMNSFTGEFPEGRLAHMHFEELQKYLKNLFAFIYRYDVLAREAGVDPGWEREIKNNIILQGGLPRDAVLDEHKRTAFQALNASYDSS